MGITPLTLRQAQGITVARSQGITVARSQGITDVSPRLKKWRVFVFS